MRVAREAILNYIALLIRTDGDGILVVPWSCVPTDNEIL